VRIFAAREAAHGFNAHDRAIGSAQISNYADFAQI
jgi:hypothetical protein